MRILIAGATGAIGQPLLKLLRQGGHDVLALTRRTDRVASLEDMGVTAVVADAMDRDALLHAVDGLSADAVTHQLTALSTPPARHSGMAPTNALRITGTKHLLEAAGALGASRFVTQSMVTGYGFVDHGAAVLTEETPVGKQWGNKGDVVTAAMLSTEQQSFNAPGIEGVALRYGCLYGRGLASDAVIELLRKRKVPVVKGGGGTMSWSHIDDAAAATMAALERGRAGEAYNIVDDEPVVWGDFLAAMAAAFGAPAPRQLPVWLFRLMAPYFADLTVGTSMRVSNAKAKEELGWQPSFPTYRDGIAAMAAS